MRKTCSSKGCSESATRKRTWSASYCEKHYRFQQMRQTSRARCVMDPSDQKLESLLEKLKDMMCPICGIQMVWSSFQASRARIITLQHWDDGTFGLICHSCNVRHGNSKLGDKFFTLKSEEKFCPRCNTIKPLSDFFNNKCKKDGKDYCCKKCNTSQNKMYIKRRQITKEVNP